jgi:hypothetical protein
MSIAFRRNNETRRGDSIEVFFRLIQLGAEELVGFLYDNSVVLGSSSTSRLFIES